MVSLDEPVENAWMRSQAQCECRRETHGHPGRCRRDLVWEERGQAACPGGWDAHHEGLLAAAGWEATQGCEILCAACHQQAARRPAAKGLAARCGARGPA